MSTEKLKQVIEEMEPAKAASSLAIALKGLFRLLDEDDRVEFIVNLVGNGEDDNVASMVHLWIAECMGEGVDPTKMCQSLVEKVTHSKQLKAVSDPEILLLFEDWLEDLEEEVISLTKKEGKILEPSQLAHRLGVSQAGATFLLSKLKRERRL